MTPDLVLIWAALIAFAVFVYVMLDGFDLGIGILFPLIGDARQRDTAINTVAPIWDGNETWLILGGGGLFAVFPLAYSVLLTAFYAPLIAMLLALVFRGVAFEFRFRSRAHRGLWDVAFAAGSCLATFCQGLILGGIIQGVTIDGRGYAGGWFDWLSPFSLFTAVALCAGYATLGAGWLVIKVEGELQCLAFRCMRRTAFALMISIAMVSLWTPWMHPGIAARWFSWPNLAWLCPVPLLVAATGICLHRAIAMRREVTPFLLTLVLFLLAYVGLLVSLYPNIIPPDVTLWQAAAPDATLGFLLIGTALLLPLVIGYTAYAYWTFRGKVHAESYH
ncbi:MAG: cytochrome d ubiquinol oxidase subunit II [Gammaproteobacteria bacterium]|nr:cytochrome d ubiquinol oxidase subunit II [Gammaproteobacteria bacterium]